MVHRLGIRLGKRPYNPMGLEKGARGTGDGEETKLIRRTNRLLLLILLLNLFVHDAARDALASLYIRTAQVQMRAWAPVRVWCGIHRVPPSLHTYIHTYLRIYYYYCYATLLYTPMTTYHLGWATRRYNCYYCYCYCYCYCYFCVIS